MNINKVPGLILLIKAELNISQYRDIQVLAGNSSRIISSSFCRK